MEDFEFLREVSAAETLYRIAIGNNYEYIIAHRLIKTEYICI